MITQLITQTNTTLEKAGQIVENVNQVLCKVSVVDKKPTRFKDQFTLEQRQEEARRVRVKYPDLIPVIVEKANGTDLPDIDKKKYLVPMDISVAQFLYVIRKHVKLRADQAIFLFINNQQPPLAALMGQIYKEHAEEGFLFIIFTGESVFGAVCNIL